MKVHYRKKWTGASLCGLELAPFYTRLTDDPTEVTCGNCLRCNDFPDEILDEVDESDTDKSPNEIARQAILSLRETFEELLEIHRQEELGAPIAPTLSSFPALQAAMHLWSILSALRGPDSYAPDLKMEYTAPIRGAVLRNVLVARMLHIDYVEKPTLSKPDPSGCHYRQHIRHAVESLRTLNLLDEED